MTSQQTINNRLLALPSHAISGEDVEHSQDPSLYIGSTEEFTFHSQSHCDSNNCTYRKMSVALLPIAKRWELELNTCPQKLVFT
jgi:hypothetical protein